MTRPTTETDVSLPNGWQRLSADVQHSSSIAEYERDIGADTAIIVSVREHVEEADYELRLSTVDSQQHTIYHSYSVLTFESVEPALEATEEFIDHLDENDITGSISSEELTPDEVGDAIGDFIGDESDRWIDRFTDRLLP